MGQNNRTQHGGEKALVPPPVPYLELGENRTGTILPCGGVVPTRLTEGGASALVGYIKGRQRLLSSVWEGGRERGMGVAAAAMGTRTSLAVGGGGGATAEEEPDGELQHA